MCAGRGPKNRQAPTVGLSVVVGGRFEVAKIWKIWILARMPTATDVVKKWGETLDQVRAGGTVQVTSHGRLVARILPPPRPTDVKALREALESAALGPDVHWAMLGLRAALEKKGIAIDEPYFLRAAVAVAEGAYESKTRPRG